MLWPIWGCRQGELSDPRVPALNGPRGDCPVSIPADYRASYCDCGCHGPIIRPGQIAWAGGGGGGTNFFIFTADPEQAYNIALGRVGGSRGRRLRGALVSVVDRTPR